MALGDEGKEFAMNLCATLAAEDIAAATGLNPTEALGQLLASATGRQLYDDTLKLWWESPRDTAVLFLEEKNLPIPPDWL